MLPYLTPLLVLHGIETFTFKYGIKTILRTHHCTTILKLNVSAPLACKWSAWAYELHQMTMMAWPGYPSSPCASTWLTVHLLLRSLDSEGLSQAFFLRAFNIPNRSQSPIFITVIPQIYTTWCGRWHSQSAATFSSCPSLAIVHPTTSAVFRHFTFCQCLQHWRSQRSWKQQQQFQHWPLWRWHLLVLLADMQPGRCWELLYRMGIW